MLGHDKMEDFDPLLVRTQEEAGITYIFKVSVIHDKQNEETICTTACSTCGVMIGKIG